MSMKVFRTKALNVPPPLGVAGCSVDHAPRLSGEAIDEYEAHEDDLDLLFGVSK